MVSIHLQPNTWEAEARFETSWVYGGSGLPQLNIMKPNLRRKKKKKKKKIPKSLLEILWEVTGPSTILFLCISTTLWSIHSLCFPDTDLFLVNWCYTGRYVSRSEPLQQHCRQLTFFKAIKYLFCFDLFKCSLPMNITMALNMWSYCPCL